MFKWGLSRLKTSFRRTLEVDSDLLEASNAKLGNLQSLMGNDLVKTRPLMLIRVMLRPAATILKQCGSLNNSVLSFNVYELLGALLKKEMLPLSFVIFYI